MPRRYPEPEQDNSDRWMVSYADFITLLFAFFVVMYAISSVNEGKYRVLSDSIVQAFRSVASNASGAQISPSSGIAPHLPVRINPKRDPARVEEVRRQERARARKVADEVMATLAPLTRDGQVRMAEGARGVTIEIGANVLFRSGEAQLEADAVRLLGAVGAVLARAEFPLTVEGHTDTTPISSPVYPSNWELSAARSSAVVRLLVEAGVNAQRLTAAGYGEQRPLDSNLTSEGRNRNRRVAILIESQASEAGAQEPLPKAPADYTPSFPGR